VVVQDGIADEVAEDYGRHAERAYIRLAEESGQVLAPRGVLFAFVDQDGMGQAEQVIGGLSQPREPRSGYAWANTIWINDEEHGSTAARAQAVAHEFTHLFIAAAAHNRNLPIWFEEGLAMHSEVTIPVDLYPLASEALAGNERSEVLWALKEEAPRPLFDLSEITNNRDWQAHFEDWDSMSLQYAQAFETVRWIMGTRNGRASAWALLHQFGAGANFERTFQTTYGFTLQEADILARTAWQNDLAREPETLQLTLTVAPAADGSEIEIDIEAYAGLQATYASGITTSAASYRLEMRPDGTLVQTIGGLDLESEELPEDEEEVGAYVNVAIHRGDGTVERVAFDRVFGRWTATGQRIIRVAGEGRLERVPGPLSDPFPSGDKVEAEYPKLAF
jgi:hypothetical protein